MYYVNEDMKKEYQEKQKGNAHYMAQELQHKHSAKKLDIWETRKKQAEERRRNWTMMEEEKAQEKQKKIDKKFELRKVMDLDFQAKRNFRFESVKRNDRHDFGENNVLSKLYEHKEH